MLESGIPYLFDTVIGGPFSAPMYLFAMGISMDYTRAAADFINGDTIHRYVTTEKKDDYYYLVQISLTISPCLR